MSLQSGITEAHPSISVTRSPRSWPLMEFLVYTIVILLIVVRFFTERFVILPRVLNAIDLIAVPLLMPLCLLWVISRGRWKLKGRYAIILCCLLLVAWLLSWLINIREVHWLGAFLLIIG